MVEWNYAPDADITIGEQHISKTAKIILICLIIAIIVATGLGIYFRNYIYDFIADPQLILSENEVDLEVGTEFVPQNYIINENQGYEYTVEGIDSIKKDTLGDYQVVFISHNDVHEIQQVMTIHVKDTTAPNIELTEDMIMLTRGDDTKNFKPADYIKSVKDNYSKKENIKIDFTKSLDFTKDKVEVIYSATDEAGNMSTATLNIAVYDSFEEMEKERLRKEAEEKAKEEKENKKTEESTTEKQTTEQYTTERRTETEYQPPETEYQPPVTEAPTETQAPVTEAPVQQAYINGVHDISVSVESDFSSMVNQLISGVSGSGYVSCDYSSVNLQVPGTYPVYWSSDDGASATSYVTVYE